MTFLYEYMSPEEHEEAKQQAIFENESFKLDNELTRIEMEHAIRLHNIDTECLINEYTENDLENMYIREMGIYTEAVANWWTKFKNWVKNIINAIIGKNKASADDVKDAPDDTTELPFDPDATCTILNKLKGVINNITNVTKPDGTLDVGKLATRLGIGAAVAGAATGGGIGISALIKNATKKTNVPTKKIPEKMEALQAAANGIKEEIDKVEVQPTPSANDNNQGSSSENAPSNTSDTPAAGDTSTNKAKTIKDIVMPFLSDVQAKIKAGWDAFHKKTGKKKDQETPSDDQQSEEQKADAKPADNNSGIDEETPSDDKGDKGEAKPVDDKGEKAPEDNSGSSQSSASSSSPRIFELAARKIKKNHDLKGPWENIKKYAVSNGYMKSANGQAFRLSDFRKAVDAAKKDSSFNKAYAAKLDEIIKIFEDGHVQEYVEYDMSFDNAVVPTFEAVSGEFDDIDLFIQECLSSTAEDMSELNSLIDQL